MTAHLLAPLLLCAGCLATPAAQAQAQDEIEQISRGIEAALLELGARNALGQSGEPLKIRKPAQVRYELGAVVDTRSSGNGLQVLAITPGGAADRLGLQANDRLLAINGTRLVGVADAGETLESAMHDSNGQLRLQVARNDREVRLSGEADVAAIPSYELTIGTDPVVEGCGYVSDELGVPPRSHNIYHAAITTIDGRSTPVRHSPNRYRLDAGPHVLTIAETIVDRHRFTDSQRRRLSRARIRGTSEDYKTLVLDVEPGFSYRIGARLLEDELDPDSIRAHEYWEPVVYDKVAVECK